MHTSPKPREKPMLDHTAETQVEDLERNIAAVRTQRSLEQHITAELHEIRPYSIVENGPAFIVAHKGMFVLDDAGENWLTFETADQAQTWISEAMNEGREAAA
jgi:hypothetical protein